VPVKVLNPKDAAIATFKELLGESVWLLSMLRIVLRFFSRELISLGLGTTQ